MASSSSSSSFRTCKYDVFPSFRGEDVRKSFLSHLIEKLRSKSIVSFIDNGIERSHLIAPELLLAIRESRISIVVLSKKYASSTWCLNELAEIHKRFKEMNQTVIPVFYELDPSDVKKQTGEFGECFEKTCEGKTEDEKQRWIQALAEFATIAGYDSRNWKDDAEMIEEISKDVLKKLLLTPSDGFGDFVGIEAHVEALVDSMLCLESDDVRMVGIWGPSGIGKSTIARALFNRLSTRFYHRAFVTSKRAVQDKKITIHDEYSMKVGWVNQFLSEILGQNDIKIGSLDKVGERLKHWKVLIVLDDVDEIKLLEALVGESEWFGHGSRIIVVTQDKALLKSHKIDLIYKVEFPSKALALQIFCQSAFRQTSPPDGFMELASEVAKLAGDLPLGLNVLGSSLRGKDKKDWEEIMPRLRNGLNGKIEKTLRISYDGLDEQDDQDIFVYIACLFKGQSVNYITNLLPDNVYPSVKTSLDTLDNKSLVRIIGPHGIVQMHILLQKLGIEIVRENKIPEDRRFLVNAMEIADVFKDQKGTNKVLGICCNTSDIKDPLSVGENPFKGMTNLQYLKIYKDRSTPKTGEVSLYFPDGLVYLPRKLRSLHWDRYTEKCIPSNFKAEHLVELTMEKSKLENLWEKTQVPTLRSLRKMNLSHSKYLKEIPDLSNAKNLRKLVLNYCKSLVTLPSSIRGLNKLKWLWMRGCTKLEVLPTDVNLESLYLLDLRGCSRLRSFPPLSRNISILYLDGTSMKEEECLGIENLTRLHQLCWENCPLKYLPLNFHPELLFELVIKGSKLQKLWEGVKSVGNLGMMGLSGCKNLIELPDLSKAINLANLNLSECESLKEIPNLSNAIPLLEMNLSGCKSLKEIPNLSNAILMNLSGCKSLKEIPNLSNARNLRELDMSRCSQLTSFPRLSTGITVLHLSDTAIEEVPSWIENFAGLVLLRMRGCKKLTKISATIWNLKRLERVDFTECGGLTSVSDASLVKAVSNTAFLFFSCLSLDGDAQEFILRSDFKYAVVPGKEVPTYFTHRARGSSLTVPIPQSSLSQKKLVFRGCIAPGPSTTSLLPEIIFVVWKFRGVKHSCNIDPVTDFWEMDHLVVFHFSFCPQEEVDDPPSQLDCNNVEFEFRFFNRMSDTYDRTQPGQIKECGVRVLDVTSSLDASDEETERCKKRMRMTGETSQEHSNKPGGKTAVNSGSGKRVDEARSSEESVRSEKGLWVVEDVCLDPVIAVREDAEIPSEDTLSSPQRVNYLRVQTLEDLEFTVAPDDDDNDDDHHHHDDEDCWNSTIFR